MEKLLKREDLRRGRRVQDQGDIPHETGHPHETYSNGFNGEDFTSMHNAKDQGSQTRVKIPDLNPSLSHAIS